MAGALTSQCGALEGRGANTRRVPGTQRGRSQCVAQQAAAALCLEKNLSLCLARSQGDSTSRVSPPGTPSLSLSHREGDASHPGRQSKGTSIY
jgi:hypothetical protein